MAELAETNKAVEDMKTAQNKALEKYDIRICIHLVITYTDTHSNEKLTQETEDIQVEEASLRYHINLLEENHNVKSDN